MLMRGFDNRPHTPPSVLLHQIFGMQWGVDHSNFHLYHKKKALAKMQRLHYIFIEWVIITYLHRY